ncbi:MAG: hypothetical protein Q8878_09290, partial [Bacillota bacterium]|nr:hypothetical protein [Bacillota bacterium]
LVTHYEKKNTGYKIYHIYDYSDELAQKNEVNAYDRPISMEYLTDTAQEVYGKFAVFDKDQLWNAIKYQ